MLVNHINLRSLREARGLTLKDLSQFSGISDTTIHRLEKGKTKRTNRHTAEKLAEKLGVSMEDLCGKDLPADHPLLSRRANKIEKSQFNVRVSDAARNAYFLVGQRFGLSASEIVEVAPYLLFWAAEQSIADRREAIRECADAVEKFEGSIPAHMRSELGAVVDRDFLDLARWEEESVGKGRNIFGEGIYLDGGGYLQYDSNPFATFLRKLADVQPEEMQFEGWAPGYAAPSYLVCRSGAEAFVGGDSDAALHLLEGRVAISEIPREILESDDVGRRGVWVRELGDRRRQEAEASWLKRREEMQERLETRLARFEKKETR